MLKRNSARALFVLLAALVYGGQMAHAGPKYGMSGCGLQSLIFEDDNSKWKQIVGSFINIYTFSAQSWGIILGTSGCKTAGKGESAALFITVNKDRIAKDVARGEGESVAALSTLVGCKDVGVLQGVLQRNYDSLFNDASLTGSQVRDEIQRVIQSDAAAQAACS